MEEASNTQPSISGDFVDISSQNKLEIIETRLGIDPNKSQVVHTNSKVNDQNYLSNVDDDINRSETQKLLEKDESDESKERQVRIKSLEKVHEFSNLFYNERVKLPKMNDLKESCESMTSTAICDSDGSSDHDFDVEHTSEKILDEVEERQVRTNFSENIRGVSNYAINDESHTKRIENDEITVCKFDDGEDCQVRTSYLKKEVSDTVDEKARNVEIDLNFPTEDASNTQPEKLNSMKNILSDQLNRNTSCDASNLNLHYYKMESLKVELVDEPIASFATHSNASSTSYLKIQIDDPFDPLIGLFKSISCGSFGEYANYSDHDNSRNYKPQSNKFAKSLDFNVLCTNSNENMEWEILLKNLAETRMKNILLNNNAPLLIDNALRWNSENYFMSVLMVIAHIAYILIDLQLLYPHGSKFSVTRVLVS
ncbi:hypothetical protein QAD02_014115 [Eretmocerus hayati]|uniref:Uncharacterized protein n=1 Tax=Eretmocerus hayati TaxID=131215 RepID=A0ACC2P5D4_9HYME|nr:hypothetical protein QAD02_014115 [Eretmocerus hayati]